MPKKTLFATIHARRGSTAEWLKNKDFIPAAGEPCFDLESGIVKWGNGVDTYEDLSSDAHAISELESQIADIEAVVAALKGTGGGSIDATVASALAAVVAGADASYDTLKEIADWILSDTTGDTKMQSDIVANAQSIKELEEAMEDASGLTGPPGKDGTAQATFRDWGNN